MMYRQSIDGCLSSKIGDAGLSEDRLTQWLTLLTPRFKALEEQAQEGSLALTILAADLLSADPFDQPAVEVAKRLTREYLAR